MAGASELSASQMRQQSLLPCADALQILAILHFNTVWNLRPFGLGPVPLILVNRRRGQYTRAHKLLAAAGEHTWPPRPRPAPRPREGRGPRSRRGARPLPPRPMGGGWAPRPPGPRGPCMGGPCRGRGAIMGWGASIWGGMPWGPKPGCMPLGPRPPGPRPPCRSTPLLRAPPLRRPHCCMQDGHQQPLGREPGRPIHACAHRHRAVLTRRQAPGISMRNTHAWQMPVVAGGSRSR